MARRRLVIGLLIILIIGLGVDLSVRLVTERRFEALLNKRGDIKDAVLKLDAWPFIWHMRRKDRRYAALDFPHAALSLTLHHDSVHYAPLDLNLRSFYYYKNEQCPGQTRYLIGASSGEGLAVIPERDVTKLLRQHGFVRVAISKDGMKLHRQDGDTVTISQSDVAIKPDDVSGDIAFSDGVNLVIGLPEPVDGVKFQDVKFDHGGLALPFNVIDPELFCV